MEPSIRAIIDEILPEIVALRHELHRHPEIRYEEVWTSDRIAAFLDHEGITYKRGFAKGTGIVAEITGAAGKTIALRTDMDALEIREATGLPYASQIPERMHACGHDGHMANLCGTIKVLNRLRGQLHGTVRFLFQPAEEQAAGARFMVSDGAIDGIDAVFGLHCWPTVPVGAVAVKSGEAMASADFFHIEVKGKGAHGADPGAGVDPIIIACRIADAMQSIVSREINPWDAAVVTVARIEGGHASNVIPETAIMEGTFRALKESVRQHLFEAVERIAKNTATAHRAEAVVTFGEDVYPPLFNDPAMSALACEVVEKTFGADRLIRPSFPTMGAEDFAYYLQKVPGAFVFLGNNPTPDTPYPNLHSPRFNFCDDALPTGIELLSRLALTFLAKA